MLALDCILALLPDLRQLDAQLQDRFNNFVERYFAFARGRRLRLKCERAPGGKPARIRKISWTRQTPALPYGPPKRRTRRLKEPFDRRWVFKIANDSTRTDTYVAFDRERRELNGISRGIIKTLRALRLSLVNKWGPRCTESDRERARAIITDTPGLGPEDLDAVSSALALDRHLTRLELELAAIVGDFGRLALSLRPPFAPHLKRRRERRHGELHSGQVRLVWGPLGGIHSGKCFVKEISGRPTDVLMRKLGLPARTRRAVGAVVRQLRPVHREYRDLIAGLGRYLAQGGQLQTRMRKLLRTPVPAPPSPFGMADRNQRNFGSTA